MDTATEVCSYEKLYFALWETAQRYSSFMNFRVIGNSHDGRMIPMLEMGKGRSCIFCLSGISGQDAPMPEYLASMASEYGKAYESGWMLEDFYEVQKLLDEIRICLIPVLNPDGYEICSRGFHVLRNPIYRQMLRMQDQPWQNFSGNARGVRLNENFPTEYYRRRHYQEQPGSENETKSLIRVFQENESEGLLSFRRDKGRIGCLSPRNSVRCRQKGFRLARHLKRYLDYPVVRFAYEESRVQKKETESVMGAAEQYYTEITRQPALTIEIPFLDSGKECQKDKDRGYEEIRLLPLEYIFSLVN